MHHGYQTWSEESLMMQVQNDDDLHGGQMLSKVKWGKRLPYLVKRITDASLK